jgi:hypothetical protein
MVATQLIRHQPAGYLNSQTATVCKVASDRSQDPHSLYALLKSVLANIDDFGGERYGVAVTEETVNKDMQTLKETTHTVSRWADKNVAHMGRRKSANPTFNDLDDAINRLGELFTKNNLVITGNYMPYVNPEIMDDWMRPFKEPWNV